MHPMLTIAIRAARAAGDTIVRSMGRLDELKINNKKENDFVSEVDIKAEQEIIKVIQKAYPDHAILAEESGTKAGDDYEWVIDPLDGTTNFLHGFPQFCVSIAARKQGKLEIGVIYDPLLQELFTAARGAGAQLNERRIRVSTRKDYNGALLGTGFPFSQNPDMDLYLKILKPLMQKTAGIRRAGSAALDLAYVAAGRLDGFWESGLSPWDMAAGVLMIQEAGGTVSDYQGNEDYMKSGRLVCGNIKIHKLLLDTIDTALRLKN